MSIGETVVQAQRRNRRSALARYFLGVACPCKNKVDGVLRLDVPSFMCVWRPVLQDGARRILQREPLPFSPERGIELFKRP